MLIGYRWWRHWAPALLVCAFCAAFPVAVWWAALPEQPPAEIGKAEQHRDGNQKSESWSAWIDSNVVTAAATFVIALFTTTLFFATLGQYRQLRRSVNLAEETAERQLRAYITLKSSQIFGASIDGTISDPPRPLAADCRPAAIMIFANTGQTPAYDVEMLGTIGLVNWPLNIPDLAAFPIPKGRSKTIVGPGETREKWDIPAPSFPILTEAHMIGLRQGKFAIVVFGEVRYKNIFKKQCFLRYRYFTGGPTGLRGMSLAAHDQGNEADYSN